MRPQVKREIRKILKKYDPSQKKPAGKKKKDGPKEQRLPLITEDALKQRDILLRCLAALVTA